MARGGAPPSILLLGANSNAAPNRQSNLNPRLLGRSDGRLSARNDRLGVQEAAELISDVEAHITWRNGRTVTAGTYYAVPDPSPNVVA